MASYHLTVTAVSRGKGKSVIAKAAYNAREKLIDERTGEMKDYSRHGEQPVFSGLFIPKDAPEWAHDRAALWNAVEAREKRKDAVPAIEIEVALPHELSDEQRKRMLTDFVREEFTRKGYAADVNIHPPPREPEEGKQPNHHAHILVARREVGPEGLDGNLLKHGPEELEHWREKWAERGAKELRKAGFDIEADRYEVGHLKIEQQREAALERGDLEHAESLNREATKHRGPTVDAMERRGIETERGKEAREAEQAKPNELRVERIEGQLMAVMRDEKNNVSVRSLDDMRIAQVSEQDVADYDTLREAQKAKGSAQAPQLREGELVAVMLDERNQPTVYRFEKSDDTEKYLRNFRGEFQANSEYAAANTVRAASDGLRQLAGEREADAGELDLSKKAGEVRLAYTLSATGKEFIDGLAERGIRVGCVDIRDVIQNAYECERAAMLGEQPPQALREGELVAVNRYGSVIALNEYSTGDTRQEIAQFLGPLAENLPGVCEIRLEPTPTVKGPIIDLEARQHHQQWEERIANLEAQGAASSEARERQAEVEPRSFLERVQSATALQHMRELNTELVVMRRELNAQLDNEELGIEHRAALFDIAKELRDLHRETRAEINALRLEAGGLIIENRRDLVHEMASHSVDVAFKDIAQTTEAGITLADKVTGGASAAAKEAGNIITGVAEIASKAAEELITFLFDTPSLPTPEVIHARREAAEEKKQAAIDWKRYMADEQYREQTMREQREKRQQEAEREYYQKGKERELHPNERERER